MMAISLGLWDSGRRAGLVVLLVLLCGGPLAGAEALPPRRDANGDPLPAGAVARLGTGRFRPGGPVHRLAYSPDGKLLASAVEFGKTHLWDTATGMEVRTLLSETERPTAIFSPDGNVLVTANEDNDSTVFWDVATGKAIRSFPGGSTGSFKTIAFAPDGKALAQVGPVGVIVLLDAATGRELRRFKGHQDQVFCLTFSPDGRTLVSGAGSKDPFLRFWNVATGEEVRRLRRPTAQCLVYSPDGKFLAGTAFNEKEVFLWDAATGKELRRLRGEDWVVAFSPDGRILVTAGEGVVWLWDPGSGRELRRLRGQCEGVRDIAFSPDGRTLATGARDGRIRFWDVESGKERVGPGGHGGRVTCLRVLADGKTLASASGDDTIRLWDCSTSCTKLVLRGHRGGVSGLATSADGKTIASAGGDRTLRLWDVGSGQAGFRSIRHDETIRALACSPDGRRVACALEREVMIREVATGKRLPPLRVSKVVEALAFSPDGKSLAGATMSGVSVWETGTGRNTPRLLGQEHDDWLRTVCFSPDGVLLAGGGGKVHVWEAATGKELLCLRAPREYVAAVAFSPDGRLVATGGNNDVVRVWELASGREVCVLRGHRGNVNSVAFFPDGRRIASASDDTTVLVWDLAEVARRGRPKIAELPAPWSDLAGIDAGNGQRALWALVAAGGPAVRMLGERLAPVKAVPEERIARLVADLDGNQFAEREAATAALKRLGLLAEPLLRRALAGKLSLEVRRRVEGLLRLLRPLPVDLGPEERRQVRAVTVLEQVGTPEARRLLERLAGGAAAARLTREAKAALARLAKREKGG